MTILGIPNSNPIKAAVIEISYLINLHRMLSVLLWIFQIPHVNSGRIRSMAMGILLEAKPLSSKSEAVVTMTRSRSL